MPKTEADLLELMRADRLVLNKSQAEQGLSIARQPARLSPRSESSACRGAAPAAAAVKGCWRLRGRCREPLFRFGSVQRWAVRCE